MHKHRWPGNDRPCTELGPTVCIWTSVHGEDEHLYGFLIAHDVDGEEGRCTGAIAVDPHAAHDGHPVWTMTGSLEGGNLSLQPSVQCTTHPAFHAFVTDGRWTG
jgi:hypothetical protein